VQEDVPLLRNKLVYLIDGTFRSSSADRGDFMLCEILDYSEDYFLLGCDV
jgi:hypothetical protein